METQKALTCQDLPSLLSSFVDTFVDFSISGGLFLPPSPTPKADSSFPFTPLQTIFPSPSRLVAIGDLHGDLHKSKQALRLAGIIDANDRWCGGSTTVVQVGDILDRGGEEIKILYFFEKLKREAARPGGTVITLNGNHEIMNVDGDFRYATPEGLEEFKNWAMWHSVGILLKKRCNGLDKQDNYERDPFDGVPFKFNGAKQESFEGIRARIAALRPNGPIARRFLLNNQTVVVVGDSVFVHGGLLPKHVFYGLEKVNEEVRDWIGGVKKRIEKDLVRGRNSIVWLRKYSNELAKDCDCEALEHVLSVVPGVKRMIMGHTIQEGGINAVCDNRAVRIDVGMSKGCGNGLPEVLEITGTATANMRILTSNPLFRDKYEGSLGVKQKDGVDLLVPREGPRQVEVNA